MERISNLSKEELELFLARCIGYIMTTESMADKTPEEVFDYIKSLGE